MRVFIDECGDFGWSPPQISLHCAVLACNSVLPDLLRRHFEWKKSVLGQHRRREIKASTLNDAELERFVRWVILPDADVKLTVTGIDTRLVPKLHLEYWRDHIAHLALGASEWSLANALPVAQREYVEMSGWLWNRSAENLATMLSLAYIIPTALQNSIVHFHTKKYDNEFDDFEIAIDRSFIRQRQHEVFWREFLRTYLQNRSRREPLGVPEEWAERQHPFVRKYEQADGTLDMRHLFGERTYFSDSKASEGLQIADACAQVCLRYHRREQWFPAYQSLANRIVGVRPMTALVPQGKMDLDSVPSVANETQREVARLAKKIPQRLRRTR